MIRYMLFVLILASVAEAQIGLPLDDGAEQRFRVNFTGGVWFPRLEGITTLGKNGTALSVGDDLGIDTSQLIFNGEASISWDRVSFACGGYDSKAEGVSISNAPVQIGTLSVGANQPINSRIEAWSINTEFTWKLFTPFKERTFPWSTPKVPIENRTSDGRETVDFGISVLGGVRLVNLSQRFEVAGLGTETTNNAWVCPYIGMDMLFGWNVKDSIGFMDTISLSIHASAGPALSGGSYMMTIRAGITIEVVRNFGVELGYRLSDWSLARDEDSFSEGGLQGLFVGISYTW